MMNTMTAPHPHSEEIVFSDYDTDGFFDEMFDDRGVPRPPASLLASRLKLLAAGELNRRQKAADTALLNMGITFNVYGHEAGTEKIWPFDLIPGSWSARNGEFIEDGLKQRIRALNMFIDDMYHEQRIVRDGVFPEYMAQSSKCFLNRCAGLKPPKGVWCHITGTDLVRDCRRHGLRAGRQSPLPLGRLLRPGEPRGHEADLPADVRRPVDPAGGRLSRAAPQDAAVHRPGRHARADGRGADAGHLQLGLFRALLPRPADGRRAGARPRPDRLRRLRLHADDPGPEAGRRDLSPHRRRLPRSAHLPPRFGAGRARTDGRLPRRPRGPGQRPGNGHRRRQGRLCLRAGDHQVLPGRRDQAAERADLHLRRGEAAGPRAGQSRQARDQADQRVGRIRHHARPAGQPGGTREISRPDRVQPAELRGPADAGPVAGADDRGRSSRRPPRRSAALHPLRRRHLYPARRADPRGPGQGIVGGELVARRREQGHLGAQEQHASRRAARSAARGR